MEEIIDRVFIGPLSSFGFKKLFLNKAAIMKLTNEPVEKIEYTGLTIKEIELL